MVSFIVRYSLQIFLLLKFQSSHTHLGEIRLSRQSNSVSSVMIENFRLRGGSSSETLPKGKRPLEKSNHDLGEDSDHGNDSKSENGDSKKIDDLYKDDSNAVVEGSDLPSDIHESGLPKH